MLAKKFLISLSILGAIGGSGAGIYYNFSKENDQKIAENSSVQLDISRNNENTNGQQINSDEDEKGERNRVVDSGEDAGKNLVPNVLKDRQQDGKDLIPKPKDEVTSVQVSTADDKKSSTVLVGEKVSETQAGSVLPKNNLVNNEPSNNAGLSLMPNEPADQSSQGSSSLTGAALNTSDPE